MILHEHRQHFERLRLLNAFRSPMLMLGNQECHVGASPREFFGVDSYQTLDPDGGDLPFDLTIERDLSANIGRFACVFNLGTIEHIWDVHEAYCNALRLVAPGGVFINHAPVGGWERHGIHVTGMDFIIAFLKLNGFAVRGDWLATRDGKPIVTVRRGGGCQTHWVVATKLFDVARFTAPQQVFRNGIPASAA